MEKEERNYGLINFIIICIFAAIIFGGRAYYNNRIEKTSKERYESGYSKGQKDGYSDGYENGKAEGLENGLAWKDTDYEIQIESLNSKIDISYSDGYNEGYVSALSDTDNEKTMNIYNQGYDVGYWEGFDYYIEANGSCDDNFEHGYEEGYWEGYNDGYEECRENYQ